MSKASERDMAAKRYVSSKIGTSKAKSEGDFSQLVARYPHISQLLTDLIEVKSKGFRGVVITSLAGMSLDNDYNPLDKFYGCNPRAIFEKGIFYALQENQIPCGKSDPLNVAKNVNKLNEDWAEGKRPQKSSRAAVRFLNLVVAEPETEREHLIDYFFFRLWKYAQQIRNYELAEPDTSLSSSLEIGNKMIAFALAYPEGGQLPQFLVARLLQATFRNSEVNVAGGEESVFGSNTTSKKPADIWLEKLGKITNLYEITVKEITKKRLDDCIDALRKTGYAAHSVVFICRLPENITDLEVINNHLLYKNKRFEFVDYHSFCLSLFSLLSECEVALVQDNMSKVVKDANTSMKTKKGWNEFFSTA